MLSFMLTSLVLMAIPGPDMAVITRNAVAHGRRAGLLTALGGVCGLGVHATAAALGLSALLMTSATAFAVVKLAGAAYLTFLGVRALWRARAGGAGRLDVNPTEDEPGLRARDALRQGWLSNALNPKAAVFFVTFLPQFMHASGSVALQTLGLMSVFALIYFAWFAVLVTGVERLAGWLRRPRVQAGIERVTSLCLLGFGARLAFESR